MSAKGKSSNQSLGSIQIGNRKFQIATLFHIDEGDLDKEFRTQASWYAYFSKEAADADYRLAVAKAEREREYASCDLATRELFASRDMKTTEPLVKAEVLLDEEYCNARDHELEMHHAYNVLRSITRALDQRSDMLISLGAHRRAELDMTGMNIRDAEYKKASDEVKAAMKARKSKV